MLSSGNPAIRSSNGPAAFRPRITPGLAKEEADPAIHCRKQWTRGFPSQDYSWFGFLKATRLSTLLQVDPWLSVPRLPVVWY
jgi:hypothetical protein